MFHLLLDVADMLSSLIDHERRPIRIEFLTLQGKPNTHVWGTKSPTQQFPFLLMSCDRPTALDYRVQDSAPAQLQAGTEVKTMGRYVPATVQSGTKAYRLPYFSACG